MHSPARPRRRRSAPPPFAAAEEDEQSERRRGGGRCCSPSALSCLASLCPLRRGEKAIASLHHRCPSVGAWVLRSHRGEGRPVPGRRMARDEVGDDVHRQQKREERRPEPCTGRRLGMPEAETSPRGSSQRAREARQEGTSNAAGTTRGVLTLSCSVPVLAAQGSQDSDEGSIQYPKPMLHNRIWLAPPPSPFFQYWTVRYAGLPRIARAVP